MKEQFLELLKQVKREGINELIEFIEKTDFFTAPASTRFHGNYEGGLVEHSMKVYEILKHKVETNMEPLNVNPETLILVPLLHDLCKANFYKIDYRNAKNALGVWEKVPYYTVDDTIWTWGKISNDDYRIYEINTRREILNPLAYGVYRTKRTIQYNRSGVQKISIGTINARSRLRGNLFL